MSDGPQTTSPPTDPQVWRWTDTLPVPWRNGGGTTRVLASSPEGADDFDWRISVADVTASGAFSAFPGVDRTIVLLDGPEMTLTVGGAVHPLIRNRPFGFDGALPASGAVPAGPTRDLNVMTRRGRCRATVTVIDLEAGSPTRLPAQPLRLVLALTDHVTVSSGDDDVSLDRFDMHRPPPSADLTLTGDGPVVSIEIHATP